VFSGMPAAERNGCRQRHSSTPFSHASGASLSNGSMSSGSLGTGSMSGALEALKAQARQPRATRRARGSRSSVGRKNTVRLPSSVKSLSQQEKVIRALLRAGAREGWQGHGKMWHFKVYYLFPLLARMRNLDKPSRVVLPIAYAFFVLIMLSEVSFGGPNSDTLNQVNCAIEHYAHHHDQRLRT